MLCCVALTKLDSIQATVLVHQQDSVEWQQRMRCLHASASRSGGPAGKTAATLLYLERARPPSCGIAAAVSPHL